MIIPILCVTGPVNWRLAQEITARLETAGHGGDIQAWMRNIPSNEGIVIYLGRLDAKTVAQVNKENDPVRVIAINPQTTTIDQIDIDRILGTKSSKEKPHGTERKPRRSRSE